MTMALGFNAGNPWYDPIGMGAKPALPGESTGLTGAFDRTFGIGGGDPSNQDRSGLRGIGQDALGFAGQSRGNYTDDTNALAQQRNYLMGLASGKNSVSAEQLRQGLQQQLAQQRSMAASADPNNAAMAARNAAMNMGQASYGMAGQQAAAGLQERNQANEALAGLNLGARGQDVTGTLGGYNAATGAYGTALGTPQKTAAGLIGGAAAGAAAGLGSLGWKPFGSGGGGGGGGGGQVTSDRNAKTDIKDGGGDAMKALDKLKGYSYRYKDEGNGKGKQYGIMAQDMEEAGLGHAVMDTPSGKVVHGAKAATAALGLTAELARRVKALEGKRK
jgi:hypothetical protein